MVLSGCTFHAARFYLRVEKSCPAENRPLLKKLLLTDPLCKRTDELFSDLLTSARILGREHFPDLYGLAVTTGGRRIVPLAEGRADMTARDWAAFLREQGGCWVLPNEHGPGAACTASGCRGTGCAWTGCSRPMRPWRSSLPACPTRPCCWSL